MRSSIEELRKVRPLPSMPCEIVEIDHKTLEVLKVEAPAVDETCCPESDSDETSHFGSDDDSDSRSIQSMYRSLLT